MSRKDFELIAATVRSLSPAMREQVARAFAAKLAGANAGFQPDRFLKACGIDPAAAMAA